MELEFKASPTIGRFMQSNARRRVLMGPFGSGKSSGCIVEILKRSMQQAAHNGLRRTRWAVVRNTMPQLRDTTIKSWMDWVQPLQIGRYLSTSKTFVIKVGELESEVLFRALDDEADLANLLSVEYTGAWMNECREIPQAIVEGLDGRIGRFPRVLDGGCSWVGMWGDTNPPEMDSYWGRLIQGLDGETGEEVVPHKDQVTGLWVEDNGWEAFIQPGGMDPRAENLEYLPGGRDYYTNLAKGKSQKSEFVKVYVHGKFGSSKAGKPVHPLFSEGYHVAPGPLRWNPNIPLIVGSDFGLTPAMTIKQQDPHGRVLTLAEVVTENMGLERAIKTRLKPLLASKFPGARIFVTGDPAGNTASQTDEKSCVTIFRQEGFRQVKFAKSNDPVQRIGATDHYLGLLTDVGPAFLIDPSCKFYIKGLQSGYHYRIDRKGKVSETVEKNIYSHVCEAGHYTDMYFKGGGGQHGEPLDDPQRRAALAAVTSRRRAYSRR